MHYYFNQAYMRIYFSANEMSPEQIEKEGWEEITKEEYLGWELELLNYYLYNKKGYIQ